MPRTNKTKLLKVRLSAAEDELLRELARRERSVSALIRKQVFGRKNETILLLGRIHSSTVEVARAVSHVESGLPLALVLAKLAAIERHLEQLISHPPQ